jgi:two-component system OmpR family response regulator
MTVPSIVKVPHCSLVLVVDDEPDLVALLCARLSRRGFETLGAGTASRALALFGTHDCDLVVCDIHLGTGSGVDFYRQCRSLGSGVPFVFLSGTGSFKGYREEIGGDPYVEFLQKPIDFQELLGVIQKSLPIVSRPDS